MDKAQHLYSKANMLRIEADYARSAGKPDQANIKELEARTVDKSAKAHANNEHRGDKR